MRIIYRSLIKNSNNDLRFFKFIDNDQVIIDVSNNVRKFRNWGPLVEKYCLNGKLHRVGGPAIIFATGYCQYWERGFRI